MPSKLYGVHQKLVRADENIVNLDGEITAFLKQSPYGQVVPNSDVKTLRKAITYHRNRQIPTRFSILTGEIFYQLRSALDHLACQLFIANGGSDCKRTEFPIYKVDPATDQQEAPKYKRKVAGFSRAVQAIIESMQPYKAPNYAPEDDPLWIIHDMNNIDKHRELLLIATTTSHEQKFQIPNSPIGTVTVKLGATKKVPFPVGWEIPAKAGVPFRLGDMLKDPAVNVQGQVAMQVAFPKIGLCKDQPVVPSLRYLLGAVWSVVDRLGPQI